MTISDAAKLYRLKYIVLKNQSERTSEHHDEAMRCLIRYAGDIEIEALTIDTYRDWKADMDTHYAPLTVRGYAIRLRVLLKWLRLKKYDVLDPEEIPVPQRVQSIPQFITPSGVQKLIDCNKAGRKLNRMRNKAIISLLYSSGIRVSELCRLNRVDVNGKNFFTVIGKGGTAAPSFIDHRSQVYIMTYLRERPDKLSALFITESGRRMNPHDVQQMFQVVSRNADLGVKVTPHTLRHSFATDLLRNGADTRHAQRMLHHKHISSTEVYLHVVDEELRNLHKQFHTT